MNSHLDSDRKAFLDQLQSRSEQIRAAGKSRIAGGDDNEPVLAKWESNDVGVIRLPADEQGILRLSIGGGSSLPVNVNCCVFRGDRTMCINLLRKALAAMESPPEGQ